MIGGSITVQLLSQSESVTQSSQLLFRLESVSHNCLIGGSTAVQSLPQSVNNAQQSAVILSRVTQSITHSSQLFSHSESELPDLWKYSGAMFISALYSSGLCRSVKAKLKTTQILGYSHLRGHVSSSPNKASILQFSALVQQRK